MADLGLINFSKTDLQTDEGVAQLNTILNLLALNVAGDSQNVRIFSGYGTPEGIISAGIGSLYMRVDGGTDTAVYKKETGTGNTGWVASSTLSLPVSLTNGGTGQNLSTQNQGDIYYDNGSTNAFSRLTPGTSGYFLKSNGAGANPSYALVDLTKATQIAVAARNDTVVSFINVSADILSAPSNTFEAADYLLVLSYQLTNVAGTSTIDFKVGATSYYQITVIGALAYTQYNAFKIITLPAGAAVAKITAVDNNVLGGAVKLAWFSLAKVGVSTIGTQTDA